MKFLQQFQSQLVSKCTSIIEFIEGKLGLSLNLSQHCSFFEEDFQNIKLFIYLLPVAILVGIIFFLMSRKSGNSTKTFYSKLLQVKEISHDTKIFTFDLPEGMDRVGLKIGEHLELEAEINGRPVARKYTPISRADLKRTSFELLIKVYFKQPPQFPDGGLMSQYINSLKLGDKIKVTLPYGRFNYLGKSKVQIKELDGRIRKTKVDHIYMVGGGTGITPLYQIVQYVTEAQQPSERPNITLLFANRTEDDILVKSELEAFEKENPTFKCYFSVDKSIKEGWKGFVGYINDEKIGETLGSRNLENSLFVVCGPPILCNIVEKSLTTKFKVRPEQFFRF